MRQLISVGVLALLAGCLFQPVGEGDGGTTGGGSTTGSGTSSSSINRGASSGGTSSSTNLGAVSGTGPTGPTGGGGGSCGPDTCPSCSIPYSCTNDICVNGSWQCACGCIDSGVNPSCGNVTCPTGCDISGDCSQCIPESATAGIGTACASNVDCCTGTCVNGICSPGNGGGGICHTKGQSCTTTSDCCAGFNCGSGSCIFGGSGADGGGEVGGCQLVAVDSDTFQPFVSFGSVASGQTVSAPVTLTNSGLQPCKVIDFGINPNDSFNEFGLQGAPIPPVNLTPGQNLNLTVTFSPTTSTPPLSRTADLSISATGPSAPPIVSIIPLSGTVGGASGSSSGGAACAPVPSGLISWWRGEGDANDQMGVNNGTLNGVSFGPGVVGQAFVFSGSSYVDAPTLDLPIGSADRSMEAWVRVDTAYPGSGAGGLFLAYGGWCDYYGALNALFAFQPQTTIAFSQWGTGVSAPGPSPLGVWQHLALTVANSVAAIYINGVAGASLSLNFNTPAATELYMGGYPLAIGNWCQNPPGQPTWWLVGAVDEASIYDRALTPGEIAAVYNAGSAGKCL